MHIKIIKFNPDDMLWLQTVVMNNKTKQKLLLQYFTALTVDLNCHETINKTI
jgi:hypothetical protein